MDVDPQEKEEFKENNMSRYTGPTTKLLKLYFKSRPNLFTGLLIIDPILSTGFTF